MALPAGLMGLQGRLEKRGLDPWDLLLIPALGALTLLLLVVAAFSLDWELHWDAVELQYIGLLINEHGRAPYRDVFDPQMPGSFLFHVVLQRVVGYTDRGARVFDLLYLALLAGATWLLLRQFDWRARWAGTILFPWLYLARGEYLTLQRDYLLILPLVCSMLVATAPGLLGGHPRLRSLLMGVCCGFAVCWKPQAGLFLVPLALYERSQRRDRPGPWRRALLRDATHVGALLGGVLLPVALCGLWLLSTGGLPAFFEMARSWWPIHTRVVNVDGLHKADGIYAAEGIERLTIRLRRLLETQNYYFIPFIMLPALLGGYVSLERLRQGVSQRREVLLLLGGAITFLVTVTAVGQYQEYVWMPAAYFLAALAAMCGQRPRHCAWRWPERYVPALAMLTTLLIACSTPPSSFKAQVRGAGPAAYWDGRPREMAAFLAERARVDDKIQLLDWFGGSTAAALRARLNLATRFYNDYQFYLDPSHPYVRGLQLEFLTQLEASHPRFVLEVSRGRNEYRFAAGDRDAADKFAAEVMGFVHAHYTVVHAGEGYAIYERRAGDVATTAVDTGR